MHNLQVMSKYLQKSPEDHPTITPRANTSSAGASDTELADLRLQCQRLKAELVTARAGAQQKAPPSPAESLIKRVDAIQAERRDLEVALTASRRENRSLREQLDAAMDTAAVRLEQKHVQAV
jgi:hypothetical protein